MTGVAACAAVLRRTFVATASPDTLTKGGTGSQTTSTTTISTIGAVAPITYSWTAPSPSVANSPTSATTSFSASVIGGEPIAGNAVCTVTDATGAVVFVTVVVTFTAA